MCGICCYIGYENSFIKTYIGILKLLNRGYCSIGTSTIANNAFITHKYASTDDESASEKVLKHQSEHTGTISICHSRWRTSGAKTDLNSHPHLDTYETFSLIHNGIIENYTELKHFLEEHNYTFKSETDTEVIVNLISYFYFLDGDKNVVNAIKKSQNLLEGTYALVILCKDVPDSMFCIRHGSPLLIGFPPTNGFAMLCSEHYGFDKKITSYITILNSDIITLTKNNGIVEMVSHENNIYDHKKINLMNECTSCQPYPHWTLKEINDQSISCLNAINGKGRIDDDGIVKLGGLDLHKNELLQSENLIMLACGTSYHSALLSTHIFKKFNIFNSIQVIDGAEFSMIDVPKIGKTCIVFISQSGETKDLHVCLEMCKDAREAGTYDLVLVGLINVVDSMIAREVDCGIYLNCGREFAVASTKAFSSQVILLTLCALWFSQNKICKTIDDKSTDTLQMYKEYSRMLYRLPIDIKTTIELNESKCKELAKIIKHKQSLFILGRGPYEAIAKEGSLKIKEIGYIHAEAYSTLALKHGPYALLDNNFPVILLTPNNGDFVKNQCVLDELLGRDAFVIGISDIKLSDKYNMQFIVPNNSYVEITTTVILQLIAYYISIEKGINCDFPRGLAKTCSTS
jgi:glucosamine--fructose-6-phosphate aminotransferase (isomerizing)